MQLEERLRLETEQRVIEAKCQAVKESTEEYFRMQLRDLDTTHRAALARERERVLSECGGRAEKAAAKLVQDLRIANDSYTHELQLRRELEVQLNNMPMLVRAKDTLSVCL